MNKEVNYRIKAVVLLTLLLLMIFALIPKSVFAQSESSPSTSVLYIPLIGITSVPAPLALPKGAGNVTYNYAVKNFLQEAALSDVKVVDDKCSLVKFVEGDDNNDSKLDYSETWRYACTTKLSETTESIATATGIANNITAAHKAYATVIVGSNNPPPLVSIINVTKVAYPLSLPAEGGKITFTYKVNNPGVVPLSNVIVSDDKCKTMSGKLGDTNYNNLLDVNEVWIYTCSAHLTQTTINTVHVVAYANGLKAVGEATITVNVADSYPGFPAQESPSFPETGANNIKITAWGVLSGLLMLLILFFFLIRDQHTDRKTDGQISKEHKTQKRLNKSKELIKLILIVVLFAGVVGTGFYFLLLSEREPDMASNTLVSNSSGWKFPVAKFPITGSGDKIAYSSIRDPGGIPEGLPVRLVVPIIGVDSAIEDALITPDGRMDVPAGTLNVAWFALGPKPGRVGSAVIGGHYGIYNDNRGPSVFYNLDKVQIGDKVYIKDDKGDYLAFVVRSIKLFDRDADATTVFTSDDGLAHLNLITCEGVWNKVNNNYPDRRVVFTDLIAPVNTPPVIIGGTMPPTTAFYRSLSLGAVGADVTALQTILAQRGFLIMPPGASYGYFGVLTRSAVSKYQTSVGLPSFGLFGPLTRARLISDLATHPGIPNAGTENPSDIGAVPISSRKPPSSFIVLIRSVRDVYAPTPIDGLITFSLLISITFMVFQIIRLRKIRR